MKMKSLSAMALSLVIGFTLALSESGEAFAARLGGGKSFGSRPSYGESYRRAPSAVQPGAPLQQPAYSAAQQRNQTMRDTLRQRGGLMGMLGGLALGGLLGAVLFGGGFEHLNFFDILVFGLIAFMLFKLFAARRRAAERTAPASGYYPDDRETGFGRSYERQADGSQQAGFDTDALFGKGRAAPGADRANLVAGAAPGAAPVIPADFDVAGFLNGAKAAYRTMQKAWDEGDLAELRALTTDKVFAELQDQIRARGGAENRTDLLKVEAELLEVRDVGSDREATVLFDAILNESPDARPAQVREIWHFVRPRNSRQPTWFLDGIQQLEA